MNCALDFPAPVDSAQANKLIVLEALGSQANPVESRLPHVLELVSIYRAGIRFAGDFRTGSDWMDFPNSFQDFCECAGREECGRSATKKDGLCRNAPRWRLEDLSDHRPGGAFDDFAVHRIAVEVAVAALGGTEGRVDVDRDGIEVHFFAERTLITPIAIPARTGSAGSWQLIHWEPTAFISK